MSKYGSRDSLVHQASTDRLQNVAIKQQIIEKRRKEIAESSEYSRVNFKKLNDEGIELIWSSGSDIPMRIAVILAAEEDSSQFLSTILMEYEANNIRMKHLEIRPERERNGSYMVSDMKKIQKILQSISVQWFPKHIADLDKCYHCVVKYEPTSDPRHPGYGDESYIQRREQLNIIAKAYKYGENLPDIEYSPEEHKTWEIVFSKLKSLHQSHTCFEYQQNFRQMELEGLLEPSRIPKLSLINKYLKRTTGFTLRPCGGLLSARDFLASLAFRVFQTTVYIRHHSSPHHSPEPDLIHEFIGHCPMFADPLIAQFSQQIGLLSLGATDEQIEQLATVYWFIIEFGLCRQNEQLKAIGAGLLSSYGELMHACSDKPQHEAFDPQRTALQHYEDSDYQPLYFVADSVIDAVAKLRVFAQNFQRPFGIIYDPYTESIEIIKEIKDLKNGLNRFKSELSLFAEAVEVLSKNMIDK
ncbi:Tyrosine 3-monooxygenase [Dirofilaria immitis]|nr:Tyrosine 3-monooxygenase [Dirofilaria immitis]